VRDKQGRKMSKQLGNSPDAVKLIEDFGADSVRVGLLLSAPAGNDLLFDESLCQQGKNFSNKVWNSFRLISSWKVSKEIQQSDYSKSAVEWFENKFNIRLLEIEDHFSKYRISDALMSIYKLVWDDFCSWYLEIVKPGYQQPLDFSTYNSSIILFKKCLTVMHPFMPFITEEIWSKIKSENDSSLVVSKWPKHMKCDKSVIEKFQEITDLVTGVRKFRKNKGISFKEEITLFSKVVFEKELVSVLLKLSNVVLTNDFSKKELNTTSFIVGSNEFHVNNKVDEIEDTAKIKQDLDYNLGFLKSIKAKLSNKRFVENAPKNVLENELKKEKDTLAKIAILKSKLIN
jgi:valyl-tRNA synthetase